MAIFLNSADLCTEKAILRTSYSLNEVAEFDGVVFSEHDLASSPFWFWLLPKTMTKSSTNKRILTKAYGNFSRPLSLYAASKVNDAALSDDLVQTTFMKTWVYLQRKGNIGLMRAFLYHTLNGLIIDEYRKHKPLSLDQLTEKGFELWSDNRENIYDVIDGKTAAALIEKLPQKYRSVVTMRFINGLTLREIATITDQSKNTTSAQVHRGLLKLRALFVSGAARNRGRSLFVIKSPLWRLTM